MWKMKNEFKQRMEILAKEQVDFIICQLEQDGNIFNAEEVKENKSNYEKIAYKYNVVRSLINKFYYSHLQKHNKEAMSIINKFPKDKLLEYRETTIASCLIYIIHMEEVSHEKITQFFKIPSSSLSNNWKKIRGMLNDT